MKALRASSSRVIQANAARCFPETPIRVRFISSWPNKVSETRQQDEGESIQEMLATPSWSVASLLSPRAKQADAAPPISPSQLRHLLRLSALSAPATAEEEESMMSTLVAQLHFVKEMQKVDTTGIKPLKAIRDETSQAEREQEVTLETLKDALTREEVVGKFYKRIRRKPDMASPKRLPEQWDPLQHAQRKAGKFFVVNSGKGSND